MSIKTSGKVSLCSHSKHAHLVIITSESQAHILFSLSGYTSKAIPAQPHFWLNSCNGTLSISPANCPFYDKDWSDLKTSCLPALVRMMQYQYSVALFLPGAAVSHTFLPDAAKMTFHRHGLPLNPYVHISSDCVFKINAQPEVFG